MPNNKSISILGVRIDLATISEVNNLIISTALKPNNKPLVIFKPYVEFMALAGKNENIASMLNKSDINVADSTALQWAASYLYGQPRINPGIFPAFASLLFRLQSHGWRNQIIPERMAGVDQTLPLFRAANKAGLKVGILGGPRDIAVTKRSLTSKFHNIKLTVWSGYFNPNQEENLVSQIARANVDVLFCALGFPKQEKFILKHLPKLNASVIIGEGGSFDYHSLGGTIRRAPSWLRKLSLEWAWRLVRQPQRLSRQIAIPNFIRQIRYQKNSIK